MNVAANIIAPTTYWLVNTTLHTLVASLNGAVKSAFTTVKNMLDSDMLCAFVSKLKDQREFL